ncbi:MAG: glycerate kinase [Clostridia bacterium]|nr:glycerate kinase [Clostridia bacterium]
MKVVIAPDSFKGTLSANEVTNITARALRENYAGITIDEAPIADGGEGTLDCIHKAEGGAVFHVKVNNPYMEQISGRLLMLQNGTAVVEMAEAAGLALVEERKNPMLTTTYGVGELIKEALERGAQEVLLALGGSATNDGGIGMAVALGLKAYDETGKEFLPTGGTLSKISNLDFGSLDARIAQTKFRAMCDVTTKLCGAQGASYVFAPQKGATAEMLPQLDKGLAHLNQKIEEATGKSYLELEGGGAAGGLGAGCAAFLQASLVRGIETILDLIRFDERIADADVIITGEGRVDNQSFMGKVLSGVSKRAAKTKAEILVLAGSCTADADTLAKYGVKKVYVTGPERRTMDEIKKNAANDLYRAAQKITL